MLTRWAEHPWLMGHLSDTAIRRVVGMETWRRGAAYSASGRVLQMSFDDSTQCLMAAVRGSGGRLYHTEVWVDDDPRNSDYVESECTCPVGMDCKHAAAVMIAARNRLESETPPGFRAATGAPPAVWERLLAPVLGSRASEPGESGAALALQFDAVAQPARGVGRYAPSPVGPRRVRLRPVVRGKSGNWVRTGVSWQQLHYAFNGTRWDPRHRGWLRELHVSHRASTGRHYTYADDPVFMDELGPSLWRLLAQAADAGVELVPSKASTGPILLADGPADVWLDLTRPDDRSDAVLAPKVAIDGTPLNAATCDFLGRPEHGLVAHTRSGLVLAALGKPLDPAVSQLVGTDALPVPAADLGRFLRDYYPALRRSIAVSSSDDSVALPEVRPPRLGLRVTHDGEQRLELEWSFEYVTGESVRRLPLSGPAPVGSRDPEGERRLVDALAVPADLLPQLCRQIGGTRRLEPEVTLSGMDCVVFTEEVLPLFEASADVAIEEVGPRPEFRQVESAPLVRIVAEDSDDPDWFDLGVSVSIDGEDVPFADLFAALARADTHLILASGTYFRVDRQELEHLRRLIDEARDLHDQPPGELRISPYQAGFWAELCELGVIEAQGERWSSTIKGLIGLDEIEPPDVPLGLRADMRAYQLDGYHWLSFLWDHGLGGILADDMGLGKTLQALAVICRAKETDQLPDPVLVVAPASVVHNWAAESARFAPGLRVVTVGETTARRGSPLAAEVAQADVVVTSYALFRLDYDSFGAVGWGALVLDEAQFVKNHRAKTYQCARRLPAPFKLAITGTPLENSLMDLWSLLSIVAPGLFPSMSRFAEFYRKPIERGADPALLQTLRRRIRPLMRRRTKEEVATELPPKQEQVLEVVLQPRHQKIYDTHLARERRKILGLVDDLDKNRFTILRSLTLLRQLSLDPSLVDPKYANVRSSKVDAFLEQLDEVVKEGHRALVFSQFTGFLGRVRDRLDADQVRYCYLDGRTRNRGKVIDAFKQGDAPVFLISLKAGGVGLNLTEADYCFVLDPWWNPAVEAQAVDRTHRIGQDRTVVVYRLVSVGTIEEKVMELKQRKAALFSRVMDDDALLAAPLSVDDIMALLEPPGH